ncbi:hypothetical protein LQG66_28355 [Bradyrhizobium ontarionense]|uniref:DUF2069 domain-containing protein n=1 Tax=Bradyrhizobium ontarionense TaxID=2898149 RepID=A0ABY3R7H1_9BRAD|nr:hypothetical protein [Bradyrhizobium sp. A19]UFZ03124.1 hypothetical protein LQG66_28355 [Bradyrhizobium sp. A19]
MWWKIIAFLYALLFVWAAFDAVHSANALTMITSAILLPAVWSLFLFAFDKRLLPRSLWKAYAIMFLAYWTFPLVLGAKMLINESGALVYAIIIAACALFLLPVVRSLWWLSFARTEGGPPESSEISAS